MKFTKTILPIAALTFGLVSCNSSAPGESVETKEAQEVSKSEDKGAIKYSVDTEGDEVMWEGYKTYADGSHYGTIQVNNGSFVVEGGSLKGGSFTIDMKSIHSQDLKGDKEKYQKLVGHLKSPDFFAVDSFPTAKFEITDAKPASADDTTGATHHVSGNLTLRGITKNITIPAKVGIENNTVSFSTPEFVIDRSKWNVKFRSTSFAEFEEIAKEKAIADNIKLRVDLEAKAS